MRGPGYKITGDVRRTWRCSRCGFERKLLGDVTALQCTCNDQPWMTLVAERTAVPRPFQRPSDIELRPIDFGIEAPPPPPPKPAATIIKSAISIDIDEIAEQTQSSVESPEPDPDPAPPQQDSPNAPADDWGEGIL